MEVAVDGVSPVAGVEEEEADVLCGGGQWVGCVDELCGCGVGHGLISDL